ncbi:hypothetical protein F5876DRAFT_81586 [Lentinula aff. lateritia]|uniref:Uncharacterized protein n=1 Tax=Lentinula aff. lateritia TaxID=2804960 RepID=A0ACC1TMN0_9AGAR|nr:hypothetical protein F5876DRAFT_81586 [Lentinula aff. lateritia]
MPLIPLSFLVPLPSTLIVLRTSDCSCEFVLWRLSLLNRNRQVEQLRTSQQEVLQKGLEYSHVLDQFQTLERALPRCPEQTLLESLRKVQEEVLAAQEEREVANHRRSASACRNAELQASMVQQQGLVDESNALPAHQHQHIETLQEEVHQFRGLIEAMITLLWQGLDSTDPNLIIRNFQVVLEYLQAAGGIHGELHVHTLMLGYSQFSNDSPFLTIPQHAGYAPPFETALEPLLYCRMFALDTALPYHGAVRWEDTVPAFPSLNSFTQDWEELMLSYVHHILDTPLPEPPVRADVTVRNDTVILPPTPQTVPMFLPELSSFVPPPLFGFVAPLANYLTRDNDDDIYKSPEEASRCQHWNTVKARGSGHMKEEFL